jgi:hypothetical protein
MRTNLSSERVPSCLASLRWAHERNVRYSAEFHARRSAMPAPRPQCANSNCVKPIRWNCGQPNLRKKKKPIRPRNRRENHRRLSLRRPVCFRGPCAVCPKGGCGGAVIANNIVRHPCPAGEFRSGGGCRPQAFLDDCNGLQMMVERQAQRMQEAQAARPSACSADPQQCSASSSSAESEASLYRELQERYQACQRKAPTAFPYSTSLSFNAVR